MIVCDFCEKDAVYSHITTNGVVWEGFSPRINWCRYHLTLYYLAIDMGASDD